MPRKSFASAAEKSAALGREMVTTAGSDFGAGFSSERIETLIRRGADVNAQDRDGNTTLLLIIGAGAQMDYHYTKIITMLLNRGADPHIKNNKGVSAYEFARSWHDLSALSQFDRHAEKQQKKADSKPRDLPPCPPHLKLK